MELDIYYRIELFDESNHRIIVLKDEITSEDACDADEKCEYYVDLDELFVSYSADLNYYDSCGIFDEELSLNDASDVYLDLTGNTKYSWRISANNNWCDNLGDDPSTTFTPNIDSSFYIDLTPPTGTITVMQNNFAPEFLDIYVTFDEEIDAFTSGVFINHDNTTTESMLSEESSNNIYHITELFPGTGLITINVESWDFVGNGILSTKEITYQEVLSTEYTQVTSPSETLTLEFDENDIEKNASILLQEK